MIFILISTFIIQFASATTQEPSSTQDHDQLITMPKTMYLETLKIANQKASSLHVSNRRMRSLGRGTTEDRVTSYSYKVGDQWRVAFWSSKDTPMRPPTDETQNVKLFGNVEIFQYEIIAIPSLLNLEGKTKVRITNEQTSTSIIAALEDLPELKVHDGEQVSSIPSIPSELQDQFKQFQFGPNFQSSLWFDESDFFGRPIQMLWEQNSPWPAYFRSQKGISILIHSQKRNAP